jgi:hypothetical protein
MDRTSLRWIGPVAIVFASAAPGARGEVSARYVRIENPTGFVMEVRQVEVFSGGQNIVRGRRDWVSGTVPSRPGDDRPTPQSIVVNAPREGDEITNGDTDTRTNPWRKSGIWRYYPRPWAVYPGKPGDLLISGPNLDRVRIPKAWLFREKGGGR